MKPRTPPMRVKRRPPTGPGESTRRSPGTPRHADETWWEYVTRTCGYGYRRMRTAKAADTTPPYRATRVHHPDLTEAKALLRRDLQGKHRR